MIEVARFSDWTGRGVWIDDARAGTKRTLLNEH